jgi:hypothetical protein
MKKLSRTILGLVIGLTLVGSIFAVSESKTNRSKRAEKALEVKVVPWGPTQLEVEAAQKRVQQNLSVKSALGSVNYRMMSFEYLDNDNGSAPTRFRIVFYDYTNDKTYITEGDFAGKETINLREASFDPGVSGEEIDAATNMIADDAAFGSSYKAGTIRLDGAMPPTTYVNGERLVNMLITPLSGGTNEVVGISFKNNRIVRYENKTPPTSAAAPEGSCGISSSGGGSTANGTAGQYQMTVMQDGTPLWEMLIIRPSASSGNVNERSGIEVRDVKYKGKSVLKRGHAPVLNVQYVNNTCGPYRDWQYAEGNFNAPDAGASNPAPGIRVLGSGQIATTAVESGNDAGNFRGVAIYQQDAGFGNELVMVSEMNAGWYRYVMEWRFAADGTIRPRYGFGSTTNGCVCNPRTHHVYWRFDFDVVQPNNKVFKIERGRKFQTPLTSELALLRNPTTNRSLLIQNANGDEAYQITPNLIDGSVANSAGVITDTYGAGDLWVMKFQGTAGSPTEIDDQNAGSAANLAPWLNNESIDNQDVVVWYGAHQYRTDAASLTDSDGSVNILGGKHVIGPDLRPVRW